jgi:ABC-type transport system substrate-binding protein
VPPELVDTLSQTPGVVKTAPGTQPKWMELNVNQPPFDNKSVRQALNYLIDKDLMIEALYGGRAVALPGGACRPSTTSPTPA